MSFRRIPRVPERSVRPCRWNVHTVGKSLEAFGQVGSGLTGGVQVGGIDLRPGFAQGTPPLEPVPAAGG